jgi:hypothetical protein
MSADTFAMVVEVSPGKYEVRYGFGDEDGRVVLFTDDLRLAIQTAQKQEAEHGVYFFWCSEVGR